VCDDRLRLENLGTEHVPMLLDALDGERAGRYIGGPDVTAPLLLSYGDGDRTFHRSDEPTAR
jgi:hypothetical protein